MPRTCTICAHKKRAAIEKAILAGESFRNIASRYGTTTGSLFRHKSGHLTQAVVKANGAAEAAHGDDLLAKVVQLEADARRIGAKAEKAKDLRAALMGVRELTRVIELLAKLRGELDSQPTVINVQVLAPVILGALEGYPEARAAVACRLVELEGGEGAKAVENGGLLVSNQKV